jgi:hypothetical protein
VGTGNCGKTKAVLNRIESRNAVYPGRCRYAMLAMSIEMFVVRFNKTVSVCETIDDHDGFVMRMANGGGFDDEVWLRWNADMMCSAGRAVSAAV